ncbi:patatin-domain-containing protein [Choiromyces venosus 120613-1]|uniref:Patatin-like phospholipase domain-containing protein n=1 Tax=Choiromyces venosus 120613-1 TaxID=1336337 RepID=A0A3N4K2Q7_9PEZI|nr:patatin-domain-containing protein [Choiromyces venosus 120613-1]
MASWNKPNEKKEQNKKKPEEEEEGLPDFNTDFINETDIAAFEKAVNAPEATDEDFITALNDWKPVKQRIRRKRPKRPRRGKDETREGFVYQLLKWPLLAIVFAWILILSILYVMTRFYISQYEYWITWRGRRERLRRKLRSAGNYEEWKLAAKELDSYLGADAWKAEDAFDYYDYTTIKKAVANLWRVRQKAEEEEREGSTTVDELRELVKACVKNNFAGIESFRMYSQTYYGTKDRVQEFIRELVEKSLKFLLETNSLDMEEKRALFKHLSSNYGRTALCLSGGASFAYYHFGVVKAHLDADLLPTVITGTSGGALVAALVCTRTDEELKKLLVPALAQKITACHDDMFTWLRRWWKTGARFDSVDWARRLCWFTRGSLTFKEAYERTGRILNISCIPSDPHSPSLLLNYLTAPDCCIFSAVLASAAVPGILNPVVLMTKNPHRPYSAITPFSFGHKWKDGSLRTDIPLRALNTHFNVTFSIVSQVNPHVNIFFFSPRGSVGRPVTHRKGKGWRGGFLGSALEQYLKLDMAKWLKVLRHLELLPRPLSQDWSSVFLQKFDGNITIWPRTSPSDFRYILSDPTRERLAKMLQVGQRCTFSKLEFVRNRLAVERVLDKGRRITRAVGKPEPAPGSEVRRRKASPPPAQQEEQKKEEEKKSYIWFPWPTDGNHSSSPSATSTSHNLREVENQNRLFSDDDYGGSSGSITSDEEVVEKFEAAGPTTAAGG